MFETIGPYFSMYAIPMFMSAVLSTVSDLVKNETRSSIGKGSVFTYASIIPSPGEGKNTQQKKNTQQTKNTRQMDTNLKIILATTVMELQKIVGQSKVPEWRDVVSAMKQNVLFEKCEASSRYGIRTYTRESSDFCKFNGDPDEGTVKDIKKWFEDVLEAIDPELKNLTGVLKDDTFGKLASVVASTGSSVDSITALIKQSDYEEYTLADVGLIRHPSYENPNAKIFRLKINSWRRCQRVLAFESNTNGLTVEIDSQEYKPRENVISHMRDHVFTEDDVTYLCEKANSVLLRM